MDRKLGLIAGSGELPLLVAQEAKERDYTVYTCAIREETDERITEFTDELEWVWDFRTDKQQPALVMTSDKSPYIRKARLTFLTDKQKFQLTTSDKQGNQRVYEGAFSAEPKDEPGDDDKLQRTYKLQFTQISPADAKETWQIVFNQQENNRYLMVLDRKRGSGTFRNVDTVGTQRKDTSFALSESYKEKTCIISEGLGTIQVNHKGNSYWVCCSGCKAAFEEEPERWIARLAAKNAKK